MGEDSTVAQWSRVLYENHDLPDNYVDQSFLKGRKKNATVRVYSYPRLVASSSVLLQQFSTVCAFTVIWWHMSDGLLPPMLVGCVSIPSCFFLYVAYFFITRSTPDSKATEIILEDFKTAILLLIFTALFAPALKTLTHTISTDTIYTMTFLMLLGHFIFHDYGSSAVLVSRAVSLNMAVFGAVCLASRLETTTHAFVAVILALQLFGLWPIFRRQIASRHPVCLHAVTLLLTVCVFLSLLHRSQNTALLFFLTSVSISLVCPAILLALQPHKDNICGPWDEAVIKD